MVGVIASKLYSPEYEFTSIIYECAGSARVSPKLRKTLPHTDTLPSRRAAFLPVAVSDVRTSPPPSSRVAQESSR